MKEAWPLQACMQVFGVLTASSQSCMSKNCSSDYATCSASVIVLWVRHIRHAVAYCFKGSSYYFSPAILNVCAGLARSPPFACQAAIDTGKHSRSACNAVKPTSSTPMTTHVQFLGGGHVGHADLPLRSPSKIWLALRSAASWHLLLLIPDAAAAPPAILTGQLISRTTDHDNVCVTLTCVPMLPPNAPLIMQ